MKLHAVLLLAAASALHVAAQTVMDYSKVPDCARKCTILDQAEKNCVPPAAPVTNQGIYQSCFCLSALLTPLHSSGTICQDFCGPDDAGKISQYYNSLCSGPVVQPANPTTKTGTTTTTTTKPTSTATTAPAGGAKSVKSQSDGQTWWDTHWKYVVMVIVIAVAIAFFWIGGIYLRRYFDRRADAKRANLAATDAPFHGSNRSVAANSGPQSNANPEVVLTPVPPLPGIVQQRLRSRSSSLTTARASTKPNSPQPVVLGPHQHLANSINGSYFDLGHPSGDIAPPPPTFPNHDAMRSDPKFVQYRATPTSITVEDVGYNSSTSTPPGRPSRFVEHPTASSTDTIHRHTFDEAGQHQLSAPRSVPNLQPEPRSGNKLHKANKY